MARAGSNHTNLIRTPRGSVMTSHHSVGGIIPCHTFSLIAHAGRNHSYQHDQTTIITAGPSSRNHRVNIWRWVIGVRKFDNATADCTWDLTKSLPPFVNLYISEPKALET